MKFSTTKEALLTRLGLVANAVSTRSAIQSLSGILLRPDGDSLLLQATDMEIGVEVRLQEACEGEAAVVLPGRLLLEVVRSLPDGGVNVQLRESERDVEISSGSATFHIRALSADEFPKLPVPSEQPVMMPSAVLRDTVSRVARAASRDEARPILTGILVTAEESTLTMVATDSYRLSVMRAELPEPVAEKLEANVPARAMRELVRLAEAESAESVGISLLPNQAVFQVGDAVLSSRLIEGQFPNYRQLLPESFEHEVRLPREELLEVVRRVGLLAQRNAPLKVVFSEGELTVSAETPDVGEASEAMPAPFQGEPLEIGFNPDFLRDGIESVESDELVFKLITSLRPGLLEPVESNDFSYLIMPIRLNV